jgi:hypothetical protein
MGVDAVVDFYRCEHVGFLCGVVGKLTFPNIGGGNFLPPFYETGGFALGGEIPSHHEGPGAA